MKRTYMLFLLIYFCLKLSGHNISADVLIYKGDTLALHAHPLHMHPDKEFIKRIELFGKYSNCCWNTASARGYNATWEIDDNDELYLLQIRNYWYRANTDSCGTRYADLKKLFPLNYKNGKVKADWVTGNLLAPKGKLLVSYYQTFDNVYETDIEFCFCNGILTKVVEYDNSNTKKAKYPDNEEELMEYICNNINHCVLPDTIESARVYVTIDSVSNDNRIEKVRIVRGYNKDCDIEAERVIKSIPEWDVIYRKGKYRSMAYTIPVHFEQVKCTKR